MTDSAPTSPTTATTPQTTDHTGTEATQDTTSEQIGQQTAGETGQSTPDFRKLYEDTLAASRKWETRAKENRDKAKKWDEAEAANRTQAEQAANRADKAEARAKTALTAAINAEIRAAAHGWATPADAPRYLDEKDRYVNDDGEIDTAAIAADVAAVLKDRPHLSSAKDTKRGLAPDASQGYSRPASTSRVAVVLTAVRLTVPRTSLMIP